MAKEKEIFCCQLCGTIHPKWTGQCQGCGEWNAIVEEVQIKSPTMRYQGYAGANSAITCMAEVQLKEEMRISSGILELDRVLGGGIVTGSATLIGGDPGIGKSTLLLQAVAHLSKTMPVLYVTGEESKEQVTLRARRLNLPETSIFLLTETYVDTILQHANSQKPKILVIDSIQTMHTSQLTSAPGSVGQVRESAMQLVTYAKQHGIALFLIGHVTKEGHLAGPRVLEHMVDAVLYFEGESDSRYRMIRAIKNRFGAVNELGIFAMTEIGLKEVSHPSAIFLSRTKEPIAGSVITATKEGSRPMLMEVQALVDQSHLNQPRRLAVGIDAQRLSMLLAILHRHSGLSTHQLDVFLNVVGGLEITETSADLAILFAIMSSLRNKPLPHDLLIFGEIGLAGEIRPVPNGQERLKEAIKHGFKRAIVPDANAPKKSMNEMKIRPAHSVKELITLFDEV